MLMLLLLGLLVGTILGLTGAGGGILAVPALVFSQGWTVPEATPIALLAVTGSALVGAIEGYFRHLVRLRAAALMALTGTLAAPLGMLAAHALPERVLLVLFALALLLVAARLFSQREVERLHVPCQTHSVTGRIIWNRSSFMVLALIGAVTGFLTGLLGVGGGFVMVPALRRASHISLHGIVATSLSVIALVGAGGVLSALWHGQNLDPVIALPFMGAAAVGMLGGRQLVRLLRPEQVKHGFALLVMVVAASMLYRAR
jgi:uncharacterized membrane protein YfcA